MGIFSDNFWGFTWFFISWERLSQLSTFFLCEWGDGFSVFFLRNFLVVYASPVNLDRWIEAFAFGSALLDTWWGIDCAIVHIHISMVILLTVYITCFVIAPIFIFYCSLSISMCTIFDAINVAACSLCNRFEGVCSVLPDLLPSLIVTSNCSTKSVSNDSSCIVSKIIIVSHGSVELLPSAIHTLCECWAVTLCICCAFLGLVHILLFRQTVE